MLDTVGFITKLPHGLVSSFKATLEEIHYADAVVHVRDISHPQTNY
jgi:GTP-binding protein HflX